MSNSENGPELALQQSRAASAVEDGMIPLIEEQLDISTRLRTTGVVRLEKHNEKRTEVVELPLTQTTWHVAHVAIGQVVDAAPPVRQEGDTTVYPVMEERLIVTRQLVLREEVHVTRVVATESNTSTHVLLHEVVEVTREPT